MPKLFVAGDSFASIVRSQEKNTSWSELLAEKLNYELINVSTPGASNESISIQIDWITAKVTPTDLVIIFLTDSLRKTITNSDANLSEKHLLEYHSLHHSQENINENIFQEKGNINSYTFVNNKSSESEYYFKNYYNYDFQKFIDITLITGVLTKLKNKTNRFIVFSGGFNDEYYSSFDFVSKTQDINGQIFNLDDRNFCDLSHIKILKLGSDSKSYNHLSDLGHKKLFRFIFNIVNSM